MSGVTNEAIRDLRFSMVLLAAVVLIALTGLALEGNWPKVLRVGLAFSGYAAVLLTLLARSHSVAARRHLPFAWFVAAGLAAGVISGIVRPEFKANVLVLGTLGAAVLLAGLHWVTVNYWKYFLPQRGR